MDSSNNNDDDENKKKQKTPENGEASSSTLQEDKEDVSKAEEHGEGDEKDTTISDEKTDEIPPPEQHQNQDSVPADKNPTTVVEKKNKDPNDDESFRQRDEPAQDDPDKKPQDVEKQVIKAQINQLTPDIVKVEKDDEKKVEKTKNEIQDLVSEKIERAMSNFATPGDQQGDVNDDISNLNNNASQAVVNPPRGGLQSTSSPGAVSIVPSGGGNPTATTSQNDDDDVEVGTTRNSTTNALHQGEPIVAMLVHEQPRDLQVIGSSPHPDDCAAAEAVPSPGNDGKQFRTLLWVVFCLLLALIIVVLATTLSGGKDAEPIPEPATTGGADTEPPSATNPPQASSKPTLAPTRSGDSSTTLPPIAAQPAVILNKGSLTCGTKAWLQNDYRGFINTTVNNRTCQAWDEQFPHEHNRNEFWWPKRGMEGNYCRNPDGEPRAWCYTTDPNVRWELCDVPDCNYCGIDFEDATTNCKATCISNDECENGESCWEGTSCESVKLPEENDSFFCGETFEDAYEWCRTPCPTGLSNDCNPQEICYEKTQCVEPGLDSWCGTSFENSNETCGVACDRGSSSQCPPGEQCFANTDCGGPPPTPAPTPQPPLWRQGSMTCGTKSIKQIDYRGTLNTTISGHACQPWDEQAPHQHNRNEFWWPQRGLQGNNYCRNPDGEPGAWCYTQEPTQRWELCDVPDCNYCGVDFEDAQTNCKSTCLMDDECPDGESCFVGTTCTQVIPPQEDNSQLYCGEFFDDAFEWCRTPCPTGFSNQCNPQEVCFENTQCVEPGLSSYCGTSLEDANATCEIACDRGSTSQCPLGQACYSGTSCGE